MFVKLGVTCALPVSREMAKEFGLLSHIPRLVISLD